MRLCAARGDVLAVLALPEHYREDDAIAHAHALAAFDPLDDDHDRTASFAALYHPWLTVPEADDPRAFRITPPDGAAAGVLARRAADPRRLDRAGQRAAARRRAAHAAAAARRPAARCRTRRSTSCARSPAASSGSPPTR